MTDQADAASGAAAGQFGAATATVHAMPAASAADPASVAAPRIVSIDITHLVRDALSASWGPAENT